MKKLILAAVAIVMGASAFAAAAPWKATTTGVFTRNSTDKYSGTIYYFDSAQYAMATVFANVNDGTWTSLAGYAAGSATMSNGASANKTFSYGDGGSLYNFYGVVVDGDYLYFTQELANKQASSSATATTLQFGAQSGSTSYSGTAGKFAGASAWSKVATEVPEPTSGLLLLLGVAGLALRRRRA